MKIGVLAVQGDFALHEKTLHALGVETIQVRKPEHLDGCSGLIMPGGESTTFVKLLKEVDLFDALKQFGREKVIFGTCAGLITLAHEIVNYPLETLDLIQIQVARNAYGRQIDSFIDTVQVKTDDTVFEVEGVFIRAPKIVEVGEGTQAIGFRGDEIVMAENKHILVATFHPELTDDTRIHNYFLQKVKQMQ